MTSQHIPYEQLSELASSDRTSEEAIQIRSHLAECGECASLFARLEHGESPAKLDAAGVAVSSHEAEVSPLNRLVAVLSFDSRQLSPAFGVRSGQSVARQLLFSIGDNDLDLRVAPDDGAWIVSGQVLGDCDCGQVVLRGADVTECASMNELCEFYLPRVPPGSYSLLVQISNMEIEVPEFELRA